ECDSTDDLYRNAIEFGLGKQPPTGGTGCRFSKLRWTSQSSGVHNSAALIYCYLDENLSCLVITPGRKGLGGLDSAPALALKHTTRCADHRGRGRLGPSRGVGGGPHAGGLAHSVSGGRVVSDRPVVGCFLPRLVSLTVDEPDMARDPIPELVECI